MGTERVPLSVAIITLNEEKRLADCLASVAFADEVVVVDSGSGDRTVEIARQCGAVVYDVPWQGFGRQKQRAVDLCRNLWVLVLDADERVSEEARLEITAALYADTHVAYSFPRKNYFSGRWMRHAGWWPDRVVRLFRRDSAKISEAQVHETVEVRGEIGKMRQPLIHYANRDLEQTLTKVNHYSSAGAAELFARGRSASVCTALLRAKWAFFYNYFLRAGFLDGGEGFVMAISDFMNVFFKYAKLRELQKTKKDPPS